MLWWCCCQVILFLASLALLGLEGYTVVKAARDKKLVLVSLSKGGSESGDVHVQLVALVWVPFHRDAAGMATAAWR